MPILRSPRPWRADAEAGVVRPSFAGIRADSAQAPLTETLPAAPGDHAAALGFALAWICADAPNGLIVWAAPDVGLGEDGVPQAEGVAQFGLPLDRLMVVRTRTQADALWATEQALRVPQTLAFCVMAPSPKGLGLAMTRRLLLAAETNKTRCLLLRLDQAGASAAWTRWIVRAAPSQGARSELGAPRFAVTLARNRAGPSGQSWTLEWNAHEHALHTRDGHPLDGAVAAAPVDRSADARQARAV